ncbi:hypothetical protein PTI98_012454 [Pleurotus ostreatus]|uniref:Stress-response A/B barrel domain-containing protein n=1 Tax=Pleurotus ostreatus (strain PC15) TaxID=1137138 RepID=A0A067N514_PLEO1|nr:hypothetical protein PTI98_012454 [Pleurotus ostreatus]KDQ23128.1 hypothetical protein PLEOSDRAFT_1079346 [Pleurotus ostreatus PC15]
MTYIHFALSKFKPEVDAAAKDAIFQKAGELVKQLDVPGLIRVHAGPPADPTYAGGYEFALTAEFEDIRGFQAYLPHPAHIKLLKLTKGLTIPSSLISYQIDTSKKVAAKL